MKTEPEVMFHVRANRKLYYAREVIDSSKIKVPGFWGEALTPSGKNLSSCFLFFSRDFQRGLWTLLRTNLERKI